ncbi:MAG: AraC family transcriptional regulator [Polyangiaceae bacterium]|nr:AraC family transcriptional regulator [Polyangiaceae bacterium]
MPHRIGEALQIFPLFAMQVQNHVPMDLHHHHGGYWELVIVAHGTGHHLLEREAFIIEAGDVFVVPAEMLHGYADCKELGLVNVLFDPRRLQLPENQLLQAPGYAALFQLEPRLRSRHKFQSRLRVPPETLARILESVARMSDELKLRGPGYEAAATAHFCHVIVELARNYGTMTAPLPQSLVRLSEVVQWLERNFDKEVNVDALAKLAHMSRSTFVRSFRACFGVPPMSYVTTLRVQKAAHLLRDTRARVKEVAPLVGIDDTSYFARVFRQHMGVDPSAYRIQYQSQADR